MFSHLVESSISSSIPFNFTSNAFLLLNTISALFSRARCHLHTHSHAIFPESLQPTPRLACHSPMYCMLLIDYTVSFVVAPLHASPLPHSISKASIPSSRRSFCSALSSSGQLSSLSNFFPRKRCSLKSLKTNAIACGVVCSALQKLQGTFFSASLNITSRAFRS